jgi:hypothetical protein
MIAKGTHVPPYMSQDLFTTLALELAWLRRLHVHDERRCSLAINAALQKYRQFYAVDRFEEELWRTADALDKWLATACPSSPEQMAWMTALRGALEKYRSNGSRKRRPLFSGLWYTSARSAPTDRYGQCMRDVARCYPSMQTGTIPL